MIFVRSLCTWEGLNTSILCLYFSTKHVFVTHILIRAAITICIKLKLSACRHENLASMAKGEKEVRWIVTLEFRNTMSFPFNLDLAKTLLPLTIPVSDWLMYLKSSPHKPQVWMIFSLVKMMFWYVTSSPMSTKIPYFILIWQKHDCHCQY